MTEADCESEYPSPDLFDFLVKMPGVAYCRESNFEKYGSATVKWKIRWIILIGSEEDRSVKQKRRQGGSKEESILTNMYEKKDCTNKFGC
jgi:hypothetical protein